MPSLMRSSLLAPTEALAAKIARMAWAIITRPGAIYERHDPIVAYGRRPTESEARERDDETVDRRIVNSVQKSVLLHEAFI